MRLHLFFLSLIAFSSLAPGQTPSNQEIDRVIYMTAIDNPKEIAEVATVIRSVAEIRSLFVDASHRSLSVHGTAEQVALAASLARELTSGQRSNTYEYKMTTGDVVHVYYMPHSESVLDFQWIVTTIRGITNLRWAFTYNAPRAFVVRETPEKIEAAEWLIQQFDQTAGAQLGSREYRVKGAADDLIHLYFVKHVDNEENLRELAVLVRSVANTPMLFTTARPLSVAVRGTAEETGLADWLLERLDEPTSGAAGAAQAQNEAKQEFRIFGDTVRLFYLRNATIQAFQDVASEIRTAARGPKVFTYNPLGALAVRGTTDQITAAQNLIDERFKAQR